ncbi:MAG: deoxyribonuclease IV [Candidatus Delongbacteria bacterium]|nr:deoxyribonuclease IV [bacterium]MBL7033006.1 deoxyribonuclease IV [Candidatus Delongbacteria bacterium]
MLGAHVSAAGGVDLAPERGHAIGCRAIQIFSRNQNRWDSPPISPETATAFRSNLKKYHISFAVTHDSYLINLCAPDQEKRRRSLAAFRDELMRAHQLGIGHVVMHPGSHLQEGETWGIREIGASINQLLGELDFDDVKIALEITAGQGTNLGYRFEHLRDMIALVKSPERMGICFDTCHGFAAGYELRTAAGWESTWEEFDRVIGLERLSLFHLNDSKKPFSSRVDRHANIGDGEIGLECFAMLMRDSRFVKTPKILETPDGDEKWADELKLLKRLSDNR